MGSVIQRALYKDKYNVITCPTHERYQENLTNTNADFYLFNGEGIKTWNKIFAQLPQNHHILNGQKGINQLPQNIEYNFVLSQNKQGQFPILNQIAKSINVPLITLEHCLPLNLNSAQLEEIKRDYSGNINVFISNFSRDEWGYSEKEAKVIHHGVDSNFFKPNPRLERKNEIIHVGNDVIGRGLILGFDIFQRVTKDLPVKLVGDSKGLSLPAKNTYELVKEYQTSSVYLNTTRSSVVPTTMLEAAAAGCAIISTKTGAIPEYFTDGVDSILTDNEAELRKHVFRLIHNTDEAKEWGEKARLSITTKFPLKNFVNSWNQLFKQANELII